MPKDEILTPQASDSEQGAFQKPRMVFVSQDEIDCLSDVTSGPVWSVPSTLRTGIGHDNVRVVNRLALT